MLIFVKIKDLLGFVIGILRLLFFASSRLAYLYAFNMKWLI